MRFTRHVAPLPLALLIASCSPDHIATPIGFTAVLGPAASLTLGWTTLAQTNHSPRFLPGLATGADGRVYVFGGQISTLGPGPQASSEVYDATTNTWSFIAPMPTPRTNQATALGNDGRIYNAGGLVPPGSSLTTSVQAYDPATNTWVSTPPFPGLPRQNLSGASGLDGRVYIAGGTNGVVRLADAAVYDPSTGVWAVLPPMPTGRAGFAMATGPSGRIYAIGGFSVLGPGFGSVALVDAYDPVSNTWSAVASLPGTRGLHSAARGADGRIYVFGGTPTGNQTPLLTDAYAYDEATNTWSPVPAPSAPRAAARGTLGGDGRIYFLGGNLAAGAPAPEALGPICTQSPTVALAVSPTELWPPNHKMVTVATGISATDDCGTPMLVVTVTSNESVNGGGDGNTSADWTVTNNVDGTYSVAVRAERAGNGIGRVYTIAAAATDGDGNVTVATGTVTVPKSK
jgi:N-acetylneuraminic acid mutarotase